ncbi:AAA family ATPase [Micromonospora zamorensis]|uniref:KGGVGR-motif variant AAA ATPase n=1 Tax=Micromonospora zamorensis TaxID=709883 RepID=UPI002E221C57
MRFDDSWNAARAVAADLAERGMDVVLVRDLLGRATLVLTDTTEQTTPQELQAETMKRLKAQCSPFVSDRPVLMAQELFAPDAILNAPDLLVLRDRDPDRGTGRLALLERGVVGREWRQVREDPETNRVTLYGFKGGVGRSTAAVVLARHLAQQGYCVLLVDLDLESPGVSAIALNSDEIPEYGLVDILIESGVGSAEGLTCVARSSRLRVDGNGEVWVAPAGGRPRPNYSYLPKLNRAYIDIAPGAKTGTGTEATIDGMTFGNRLRHAVDFCVEQVRLSSRKPDVVLLDSRAGLHDVAAVAITQLSDITLLFGTDNTQTWNGYTEMFQQWKADVHLTQVIRDRLRVVAAMVPASSDAEYLTRFRDKAHLLFSETLYDEATAGDFEAYSPPLGDSEAPHSPLPILFSTDLVGIDSAGQANWIDQDFITAAYESFVHGATELIVGTSEDIQ